jgi:tRNA(Arg) A34 adenosine deaminase TadA
MGQGRQDALFMALAIAQAELAITRQQTPFGAVVVDGDGRVICEGHNTVRADLDPSAHGEVVAIRDAWRKLGRRQMMTGCTLYTSCEPCLLCSSVIAQLGFSRVVFAARGADVPGWRPLMGSNFTEAAAWINAQPDWPKLEVRADFMRDEARAVLAKFRWD